MFHSIAFVRLRPQLTTQSLRVFVVLLAGFALSAIAGQCLQAQDMSEPPLFERAVVLGLEPEQEEVVRAALPFRFGEEITQEGLNVAQENLGETDLPLDNLKLTMRPASGGLSALTDRGPIRGNRVELVFDFRPTPVIQEIDIFPLIPVDTQYLLKVCPLIEGEDYDPRRVAEAAQEIQREASELFFAPTQVRVYRAPLEKAQIALGFIIEGEEPSTLHKIRFPGAGFGNGPRIRQYFKDHETMPFDEGSTVTAARLQQVEEVATALMNSQGYLDATVRLDETTVSAKGVRVIYHIDRGPRYRMEKPNVEANRLPDPEYWEPVSGRFENMAITSKRLREMEKAFEHRSQESGYMAPDIQLSLAPSEEEKRVRVEAKIDEGRTSRLGEVRIERTPPRRGYGKSWYHESVAPPLDEEIVRKQIRARLGDALNREVLRDGERRLWRLGTFQEVELETAPTDDPRVRDIVARVQDQRTASLGASLGWNDQAGPILRGFFTERNVGGRADVLSFGGWTSLSEDGFGGEVNYLDRYWKLGEKLIGEHYEPSMLYSVYLSDLAYDEYAERRTGARLRFGYLVGERMSPWTNSWIPRVEKVDYSPYGDDDEYDEEFDSYLATTLAYHVTYDTRDRGDYGSTEGLLYDLGIEAGRADGELLKWTNYAEYYHPLARRWGWVSRGQFGLMPMDADEVGLSDRFQLGGLGSVRGFDTRGIGPVDAINDDLHVGGATLMAAQNEIRFILNEEVDFPVFFDMGTLHEEALAVGPLRASTGIGVRFQLPASNQRAYIYYAENLIREDTDDERRIHFGFTFGL